MRKFYRHRYTVTGTGSFPVDMLRYDASYPATSDAARAIEHKGPPALRHVLLEHIADKNWRPTGGRWASFLWSVSDYLFVDVGL